MFLKEKERTRPYIYQPGIQVFVIHHGFDIDDIFSSVQKVLYDYDYTVCIGLCPVQRRHITIIINASDENRCVDL